MASTLLLSSSVVVPDAYLITEDENLSYIYTQEHTSLMASMKAYQEEILKGYEKEFGFQLDEKLHVGLASNNNQIANGFSTQIPFNSQLFYGAGAAYIDYFSSTSWLKNLIVHETAHNFQLNPKENFLSKRSHQLLGNTPLSFVGILPLFPIPNLLENPFVLEGNAVMNESRFGNGGRLFSGYALAEVVAMAKAGAIRPELMYNATLTFPYGEKAYLVGGFFQHFLVQRYGVERVNGYFKTFSTQPFPFFTNRIFKEQYGKSFEVLLSEFVEEMNAKHADFRATKGELLAKSQIFVPFNRTGDEIYTLIGDNKSAPKLYRLNRKTMRSNFEQDSWRVGEVFNYQGEYYTQSVAKTSPVKIEMGLFDKDGFMLKGFEGKALQGFTASGKEVYFDIAQSIEAPQVYVDGKFYTQSHSSVHVDKEDLYYFKQEGEKRTLYKNKTALVSFEGHYGFVTDVDKEGAVYFIATSAHGSTAYRAINGLMERVTLADDVIDFKLLNQQEALVATIGADGYAYYKIALENRGGFSQRIDLPKQDGRLKPTLREANLFSEETSLNAERYNSVKALKYSSLNQVLSYSSYEGFGVDLQANFVDPLMQNALALVLSHNTQRTIGGVSYDNDAHALKYGGAIYGVHKNDEIQTDTLRNVGYDAYLKLPFLASGYWSGDATLTYSKDYENLYREPLSLSFTLMKKNQYGISKYANALNALELFVSSDRDAMMVGGTYSFQHDLAWQLYVGAKATYIKSNRVNSLEEKGVELREGMTSLQSDKATLDIPSFSSTVYAKEVKMTELSMAKVFDGSFYRFSFPLSLQREAIYAKQRIYNIDFSDSLNKTYYETIIGTEFDLVFFNQFEIPFSLNWIYNKNIKEKNKFKALFGIIF
jgi:hypothetical protein